jgi:hypothetical protein
VAKGIRPSALPALITAGPDGKLWFTEFTTTGATGNKIGQVKLA